MPTRITLRETAPQGSRSPARKRDDFANESRINAEGSSRHSTRRIVSFRTSLIREIHPQSEKDRSLSTTDIRASPRLIGYMTEWMCATVMLISVVKLWLEDEDTASFEFSDVIESSKGGIYKWKYIGCIAMSAAGSAACWFVILVHFDTVCFPRLWLRIFRDGSNMERRFLLLQCLFWASNLHVSTSTLSVGEWQANIFFGSWIAFVSSVINFGVWRVSAGYQSIAELVSDHYRETTYNWVWTTLCVATSAGAICDMYGSRDAITQLIKGEELNLSQNDWVRLIVMQWGFVALCLLALILNHCWRNPCEIVLTANTKLVLGWRQLEGVILLALIAVFFFFVYEYTGVDGVMAGLSNGYFAIWGAWINSVFTFGTWLRENKNIAYIVQTNGSAEESSTNNDSR